MLTPSLYTLTRSDAEGGEIRFRARLNASHPLFAGHFPGQPVLPGVCTLAMIRDCLSQAACRPVRFATIRDCKFTAPVDPRRTGELELRLVAAEGSVRATAFDGDRAVLKLKATYIPLDD